MKRTVILIIALGSMIASGNLFAQTDKFGPQAEECLKYLSYYEEYYKQKAYDEATPNWREAYKYCPASSRQTMLINGTTLMRRLIQKNAKNPEYRKALIDSLFTLHDQRAQYFPKYKAAALNNKGQDVYNFLRNDKGRQYKEFEAIIGANAGETKPTLFVHDFNIAVALFEEGKLTADDIFAIYQRNNDYLSSVEKTDEVASAEKELETRFVASGLASCDKLVELFEPKLKEEPENLKLATNIVKLLSNADDCTGNDLYLNAVTTMHRLDPSYNSAYYLYRLNATRGNTNEAIEYLKAAIADEGSDAKMDADYCFQLSAYCLKNGRSAQALQYATQAAELDSSYSGKAFMVAGQIWGSTACGGDEIARRAPYWVAVDYMIKAKNADESLTEDANRLIAQYSKYYPEAGEAFMYNLTDGQSYTVSCGGMRAVTTVRTQK